MIALAALLLALSTPATVRSDTLLVEVVLASTQSRIVVEAIREDSALLLPAVQVHALLGLGEPTRQWIAVVELERAYPTVAFVWLEREMRLVIIDRLEVLPASRKAKAEVVARAHRSFSLPVQSGPFGSLAVDDSLHGVLDLGYSHRGRLAVAGRVDDRRAGSWGISLAPSRALFLMYHDGVSQPPTVSGRVAAGPLWLSATYTPDSPLDASGLVRIGDVSVFASRQFGVVTFNRSAQVTVSAAHHWEQHRTAARVSVGPSWASPFAFPVTSLSRTR